MNNSLGNLFTVTVFGESHGPCIGAVIDGCPAGLALSEADIQGDVDKRRPGAVPASTARRETDKVEILSGVHEGHTSGVPVCVIVRNEDVRGADYKNIKDKLRPGHADYTARIKYGGFNDGRGGGQFSGRITVAFMMAGAIARKLLQRLNVEIFAHTVEISGIRAITGEYEVTRKKAALDLLHCADPAASKKMAELIAETNEEGDSLGGIIEGIAVNLPPGLGEPVFDNLDGELAKALFAIPAVKGVEFGAGFGAAEKKGSQNNDAFVMRDRKIVTVTNNAGGILGGISNGMPIVARVAIKPTPSIRQKQMTVNLKKMENVELVVGGRHDVCIVPRAVIVVESMMAVTLCDFALRAGIMPRIMK